MQIVLIESIDKLPIEVFFHCMVEKDYSGLILSGNPDEKRVSGAWNKLFSDYLDIVGDDTFSHSLELTRQINRKALTMKIVEAAILLLQSHKSQVAIDLLKELGYILSDDYTKEVLEAVELQLKSETVELDDLKAQIDELKKEGQAQEPTYEYYNRQMASIEIGLQLRFPIDPSATMLSKYATWLVMLRNKYTQSNGRLSK